ncbi:hypothetical protein PROFUN_05174 [Planoprotostelium fungivorum]|uniref:Uncharacterized protein n=1 Tax=Planoprotostelium fungivorum TaxID=1890364 RepID=A0A2P6NRF7_9EUKA|nr:hypothetical protein PROFUN_05174 [Planoprotostelium fungivorum]
MTITAIWWSLLAWIEGYQIEAILDLDFSLVRAGILLASFIAVCLTAGSRDFIYVGTKTTLPMSAHEVRKREMAFQLFMGTEKATILFSGGTHPAIVLSNEEAGRILSEILLQSAGRLKRTSLGGQPYVILTAKELQNNDTPAASFLRHGPADEISLLSNAIEDDLINRTLGLRFLIFIVSNFEPESKTFTFYAANPAMAVSFGNVDHPSMLRGKRSENVVDEEEIYQTHLNVTTGRSSYGRQGPMSNYYFHSEYKMLSPLLKIGFSFVSCPPNQAVGPSPPAEVPPVPTRWPKSKWDSFIEETLRYVSRNPEHLSLTRLKLPPQFLQDPQNVYGYVYGGKESFLPSGNKDGYIWKSSRVTYHPGSLKRKYFYAQTADGQKLRRRVMWLDNNEKICMVEYGHLVHSGDIDSTKLMGPGCMDWPSLVRSVTLQESHTFLSSTEELHKSIDMAAERTDPLGLSPDNIVSYVNGILHHWASQHHKSREDEEGFPCLTSDYTT